MYLHKSSLFSGCVDPSEDYIHKVIEPVQKSVIVLGNFIGHHPRGGFVNKSASLHNSLPDIVSNDPEDQQQSPQPPRLPARLLKATHTSRSAGKKSIFKKTTKKNVK